MDLHSIPIDRINPAPYNPRKDLQPGDPEYEKLQRSIEEFGCVEPLVWNRRTGNLIGGHQRLKILKAQGDSEVYVSVIDLSLEREKALNVALNKIAGDWDPRKLAELLDELTQLPGFDIELTGFDLPDADALISEVLHSHNDEAEDFDVEAALRRDQPAVTRLGDLIELGRHRLLCGDSSTLGDVQRLLGDDHVDLLLIDPPYNVDYYGGNRPTPQRARPKRSRQWNRIYADNLSQEQYVGWLGGILGNVKGFLVPGAAFYIWNGHRQFGPMHLMLEQIGLKVSCVITWAKESFAIGYGDYNQQTEFCLYGWLPHENKGSHNWYGPTNESTLWEIKRDPTKSYQHPTQKPLELAERAMRNSTRPGRLILDTFLGSGTTLIAAERTGRRCLGIEIDPYYCDVVVRRYLAFVGECAVDAQLTERYRLSSLNNQED
ncbi:MAG: DNA modification methylase [Planctomycetes bacterium]|nr:DNA modification methylase [Planctomycetota bacterium]